MSLLLLLSLFSVFGTKPAAAMVMTNPVNGFFFSIGNELSYVYPLCVEKYDRTWEFMYLLFTINILRNLLTVS